jgi:hypothetical protein
MRKFVCVLTLALASCIAHAVDLFPCPDCEQPVSPRAIMCPHCGCPGAAIKTAVTAQEAAQRPPTPIYPVAALKTGEAEGAAVAYTDGENQYLVIDAYPLMGAISLDLSPLTTNTPIAYHSMQVAAKAPLVRFQTAATNISFLSRAPFRAGRVDRPAWLHADGRSTPRSASEVPPESVVALLDSQTNLVSVIAHTTDKNAIHVPLNTAWVDIAPRKFREQTALLLTAQRAAVDQTITPVTINDLNRTQWATPFFERTAKRIIKQAK